MDVDWPVELLGLEAAKMSNYQDYRAAVLEGPEGNDARLRAIHKAVDIFGAHRDALMVHLNRPVCCVACNGTGTDPIWGNCLICDGHRVTDRRLRATLQSVKALNLAIGEANKEYLRRKLIARHEAEDRRLGVDGRWDV